MKYAFRRYATGPKAKMKDNWDLPLNLQACPKCKTLNHKMATLCSKCGHSLSEPSVPAHNPVASTAPAVAPVAAAEHEDLSQSKTATIRERIPHTGSPSGAVASNASQAAPLPAHPMPDMLMVNRQFTISNEQKWLRRIWGLVLLASIIIPVLIVVFSLQTPSAPPPAAKNPVNKTGGSLAIAPQLASIPAAAEQKMLPPAQDQALVATEPVIAPATAPVLAEPVSPIPTRAKQSAHAAPPRTAQRTSKKIARTAKKSSRIHAGKAAPVASKTPEAPVSRPRQPLAPANAPCSKAARALALCNR